MATLAFVFPNPLYCNHEPTGELESKTAKEIIALLFEFNTSKKTTVIVATHDEKLVEAASSIYTIRDGTITFQE